MSAKYSLNQAVPNWHYWRAPHQTDLGKDRRSKGQALFDPLQLKCLEKASWLVLIGCLQVLDFNFEAFTGLGVLMYSGHLSLPASLFN